MPHGTSSPEASTRGADRAVDGGEDGGEDGADTGGGPGAGAAAAVGTGAGPPAGPPHAAVRSSATAATTRPDRMDSTRRTLTASPDRCTGATSGGRSSQPVGEEREPRTDRPGLDEPHRPGATGPAGVAEEPLTRPENDGEDHQPQLVD